MNRIIFAHQLRGVAALLIVVTHYFGVYFGAQAMVDAITFSPDLSLVAPTWVRFFDFPYLKGPFGVALFFLISGFVIPFSLSKQSCCAFLVARFFRIFPTYLFCLGLGLCVILGASFYWHTIPVLPARLVLSNGMLVNDIFHQQSLDSVNWTLNIEIKFYLLAALLTNVFLRKNIGLMLIFASAAVMLGWLSLHVADASAFATALVSMASDLKYLVFMLIGVIFYQHLHGMLSSFWLVCAGSLLLACFSLAWRIGPQQEQYEAISIYYDYALIMFGACYASRAFFRPVRLLDFFADISYPLYVVHTLTGYTLMKILMSLGMPFGLAVCTTLLVVITLAFLIHRLIETRSTAWGRSLAARRPFSVAAADPQK